MLMRKKLIDAENNQYFDRGNAFRLLREYWGSIDLYYGSRSVNVLGREWPCQRLTVHGLGWKPLGGYS